LSSFANREVRGGGAGERARRFAGYAAITTLVAVALLEVLLRIFDPIGIAYYFETAK